MDLFPAIAYFAKHSDISIKGVSEANSLEDLFHIPISHQAAIEFEDLSSLMQNYALTEENDRRIFYWGNSNCSATKIYKLAFSHIQTPVVFSWVWKSK